MVHSLHTRSMQTYNDGDAQDAAQSCWPKMNNRLVRAIVVGETIDGRMYISTTEGTPERAVDLLDKAMEAIDGQRLPPDA